ncbi:atrophin-1-like [Panicum miliaceum]|uniref:Atrophin-1-like n=1 Tax=Panicum miliaceum TaxID=4540 RepID=A0A3L6Q4S7_PANMI|nr:atrophin-1-like [Panicum miliaceum]
MVPARNLQLLRDAHAAPCAAAAAAAAGIGVTTAPPSHMAQEPIDHHHHEPSKPPPPPPPQERQADLQEARTRGEAPEPLALRPLQHAHQEAAGTSGSSSGSSGNGGAGDWLRLGLAPASPGAGAGAASSQLGAFAADRAAGLPLLLPSSQPRTTTAEALPGMGVPPGAFLRQAAPGIPQASITLPAPRAGPPWLPPWSPAAAPPPLIPFGHRAFYTPGAGASGLDAIRVVLPPAAGVWFVLQAATHQGREPFLPQIPRSYLRIKDGRVTVRLLIKYLAGKLGLEDESQVEITCRGRPLPAFLTLQHVRDGIWCQGDAAVSPSVAPPDMPAANHLMVLQYGRRP